MNGKTFVILFGPIITVFVIAKLVSPTQFSLIIALLLGGFIT